MWESTFQMKKQLTKDKQTKIIIDSKESKSKNKLRKY